MAAKPTEVPEWATSPAPMPDSGPRVVQPPPLDRALGWEPFPRDVPAAWMNWLFFTIFSWILYLRDQVMEGTWQADDLVALGGITAGTDDIEAQQGDVNVTLGNVNIDSGYVSAQGGVYHGPRKEWMQVQEQSSTPMVINTTGLRYWALNSNNDDLALGFPHQPGTRVISVTAYFTNTGTSRGVVQLYRTNMPGVVFDGAVNNGTQGNLRVQAIQAAADQSVTAVAPASDPAIPEGVMYWVHIGRAAGTADVRFLGAVVEYERLTP